MSHVICATTEKGGSGKSTFVTNMGVYWAQQGSKVLIVDLDPQRSATMWSQVRAHLAQTSESALAQVEVAYLEGQTLGNLLNSLRADYDMILLDVPGADNSLLRLALMQADLAVIPTTVGGFDYLTSAHTMKLVREAQELRAEHPQLTELRAVLFLNQTRKSSVGARGLKNHYQGALDGITLCKSEFGFLDDFWSAAQQGMGVLELNGQGSAASQVRKLGKELDAHMSRGEQ